MKTTTLCQPLALGIASLLTAVSPAFGQGSLLAQHLGSANPTSEGFSLISMGSQARVGPLTGDMGVNAWATAVSNVNNNVTYQCNLTSAQQAQLIGANWVLSVRLRVVQSAGFFGNNYATFYTGADKFSLFLGAESNGDPFALVGDSSLDPVYVLQGGGAGYHDFELRYSAAADTADLWIDGVQRLTGLPPAGHATRAEFEWGESQGGPSQANWGSVSLAVPEPPSLALLALALGGLGVATCRRRHRDQP